MMKKIILTGLIALTIQMVHAQKIEVKENLTGTVVTGKINGLTLNTAPFTIKFDEDGAVVMTISLKDFELKKEDFELNSYKFKITVKKENGQTRKIMADAAHVNYSKAVKDIIIYPEQLGSFYTKK